MKARYCSKTIEMKGCKGSRNDRNIPIELTAIRGDKFPYISPTEGLPNGSKTQTTLKKMMGINSGLDRLIAQAVSRVKNIAIMYLALGTRFF